MIGAGEAVPACFTGPLRFEEGVMRLLRGCVL